MSIQYDESTDEYYDNEYEDNYYNPPSIGTLKILVDDKTGELIECEFTEEGIWVEVGCG